MYISPERWKCGELNSKVLNEVCDQLVIKRLFFNQFHAQGYAKVDNGHNFLKLTLSIFLEYSDLEWDELLPFICYGFNIFPGSNDTESLFFLTFR